MFLSSPFFPAVGNFFAQTWTLSTILDQVLWTHFKDCHLPSSSQSVHRQLLWRSVINVLQVLLRLSPFHISPLLSTVKVSSTQLYLFCFLKSDNVSLFPKGSGHFAPAGLWLSSRPGRLHPSAGWTSGWTSGPDLFLSIPMAFKLMLCVLCPSFIAFFYRCIVQFALGLSFAESKVFSLEL